MLTRLFSGLLFGVEVNRGYLSGRRSGEAELSVVARDVTGDTLTGSNETIRGGRAFNSYTPDERSRVGK
jgi:hypothetical protein